MSAPAIYGRHGRGARNPGPGDQGRCGRGGGRRSTCAHGELTLTAPAGRIVDLLAMLRDNPNYRFVQLLDVCGVDYPDRELRFDVVYHLLSMTLNRRIRIKVQTDEDTPVPSVAGVFPCRRLVRARDLRHVRGLLLRPPGFAPHPHRLWLSGASPAEGFPHDRLCGGQVGRGAEAGGLSARAAAAGVPQFDFLSPWEGAKYALPGDEKAIGSQPAPPPPPSAPKA